MCFQLPAVTGKLETALADLASMRVERDAEHSKNAAGQHEANVRHIRCFFCFVNLYFT